MGAITPSFVMDLQSNMRVLQEQGYQSLIEPGKLWWQKIAKVRPSGTRRDILTWLLSTAMIEDTGTYGDKNIFEDLVTRMTEIENTHAGANFKIKKDDLSDTDANGMALAAQWSKDIGAYMGYFPQKKCAHFLKNAHTAAYTAYDGQPFFDANHPQNPYNPGAGDYSNLFTGVDISNAVTADVALANLQTVFSNIASIKMPNGEDPRGLRPKAVLASPLLAPRVAQLTSAKTIAQAAATGGGGADVEAIVRLLGYADPTQADELAGFESDKTYFVVAEQVTSSDLGAVAYVEREPFKVNYYSEMTDAELGRINELEWKVDGRYAIAAGHPFLLFKCKP